MFIKNIFAAFSTEKQTVSEAKNQSTAMVELGQASQITLGRGNAGHEGNARPAFW